MNVKQFCPKGHDKSITGRTKQNNCRECNKARLKAWRLDHTSNVYINSRNLGFRTAGTTNADGTQFTYVDYDRAYQVQQGRCKGCGIHQSELKRRLSADHDHKTGIFRFLLCTGCNGILGYSKDSADLLRRMADLLEGKQTR